MSAVTAERIAALSPRQRELLERRLQAARRDSAARRISPRSGARASFPLSFAQQRLWFLDQFEPGDTSYNNPVAYRFSGPLDVSAVERALNEIIRRHEILRTVFVAESGQPVQLIRPAMPLTLRLIDLSALPADVRQSESLRLASEEAQQPFDLSTGPLLRAALYKLGADDHLGVFTMHHIVCDAWSIHNMMREMAVLYEAYQRGQSSPLPALPIQYADYAAWQREWLQGETLQRELAFWRTQLADAPALLELPTDRPRPPVQSLRGGRFSFVLAKELTAQLKALARREGETLFVVLLAAFEVLLYRYTNQTDLVVGTPITNRSRVEVEPLIGLFLNTLALRTRLAARASFRQLVQQVGQVMLAARAHQEVPFERVVEAVGGARSLSHTPLFQVMFTLVQRAAATEAMKVGDLTLGQVLTENNASPFDLTLAMNDAGQVIAGSFEYSSDLFDHATIVRMAQHFTNLLHGIVRDAGQQVCELPLLSEAERRQSLSEWQGTARAHTAQGQCIHELFEAQAALRPDAIAVVQEEEQLTYGELNARANQLARTLRRAGVGPEVPVGVLLERSPAMIVAILGVTKAGGGYVPIDPQYPQERIRYVLEESGAPLLLTQRTLVERLPQTPAQILCIEDERIKAERTENVTSGVLAGNLAYIIYTSGSTGRPKGVAVAHRSLVNYINIASERFGLTAHDRVLQFASLSFDASAEDIYTTLTRGATLVLRTDAMLASVPEFLRLCRDWELSVIDLPTAFWHELMSKATPEQWAAARRLRLVIIGGEKALPERMAQWQKTVGRHVRLLNGYGPTEATIAVTLHELPAPAEENKPVREVSIGRPLANTQIYILDGELQPVPVGVVGELFIGGEALARGYWQRADLTADKFLPHPFSAAPGARLYRTGDTGRHLPDGRIECVGRTDQQVKVRGFRIELGEVEAALIQHAQVQEASALVREDTPGERRLVAYIVATQAAQPPTTSTLRDFLKSRLPEYMIPAIFIMLDALPLTPSGKVDRQALPAPAPHRPELATDYVAPRTETERLLAAVWHEVLGLERVGINDNFFELGGDSILSIQVVARAARLGLRLTPRQMFEHQTVAELAAAVALLAAPHAATDGDESAEENATHAGAVALTPIQRWFFAEAFPEPHHFNQSVLLECRRPVAASALGRAVGALIARHDALRLRFERTAEGWRQWVGTVDEACALTCDGTCADSANNVHDDTRGHDGWCAAAVHTLDYSHITDGELKAAIESAAARVQTSFELARGPVLRVVLFACGAGRADRLLVVAHHLAVDGVSWRILLEDLQLAYSQLERGDSVALPPQTASFRRWAGRLTEAARSDALREELDFWCKEQRPRVEALPLDDPSGDNTVASEEIITLHFSAEQTRAVLQLSPALYRASVEEVLLTATARALTSWGGAEAVAIDLEGHGREDLSAYLDAASPDVSRTVGWFTSVYPLLLEVGGGLTTFEALARVRDEVRRVPARGIGYGLLKYLGVDEEARHKLAARTSVEVLFNYLGQFNATNDGDSSTPLFALSEETAGATRSTQAQRTHQLEFSAGIFSGRLQLSCTYSRQRHHRQTIEQLCHTLRHELLALAGAPLVALQPFGQKPPLFLLHPSGGQVMCYLGLARRLGSERPVYGLRGFDAEECFDQTLEEMAQRQVAEIRRVAGAGPYLLGGWSFGALLAYEVAQQLRAAGGEVALLAILDIGAPLERVLTRLAERENAETSADADSAARVRLEDYDPEHDSAVELARLLGELAGREFAVPAEQLVGMSQAAQVERVVSLAGAAGVVPAGMGKEEVLRALRGYQTRQRAARAYRAEKYAGQVAVFVSREVSAEERALRAELYGADETLGWAELVAPLPQVLLVDGSHQTFVNEPHVGSLADKLRECIERIEMAA